MKALIGAAFLALFTLSSCGDSAKPKAEALKPAAVEENGKADYEAAIRGVRKNLILLDLFIYENKGEPYYVRAKESLAKIKGGTEEKK